MKAGSVAQACVAVGVMVAFFAVLYWLLEGNKDLTPGVKEVVLVLTGVLAGAFKDVVGFFLGSSLGSQRKDEVIRQANPVP